MNKKDDGQDIIITKQDVAPYVYFVCSLAQRGKMYGGLSGKSDYIGGVFDRWINIIPESVIFNKYFLPKISDNLEVISDYYEYDPKKSGIAPDVLGVKIGTRLIPFVQYVNEWQPIINAPQIEVKSFKKSQYMISLRNQGYDNQYLVMVETNLDSDYLLPFFDQIATSEDVYKKLEMDDTVFIKSNENKDLLPVTKIKRDNTDLGSLKLITVCLASDFMEFSNSLEEGESPFYITKITDTRTPRKFTEKIPLASLLYERSFGFYRWKDNILDKNPEHKIIDVYIENIHKIDFVKSSKSSITIYTKDNVKINSSVLSANQTYIIKFQLLDRSGSNVEYFMHKSVIDKIPSKENLMLKNISKYISLSQS